MKKRFAVGAFTAVLTVSLLGASGASAAVEFGDTCIGTEAAPGDYTLATLSSPGPLPLTAPSAGVVTKVKVSIGVPIPFAVPTVVKTVRSAGGSAYTVIGQSTIMASAGTTVADVRLPVNAGDRLGLHGEPFTYEGSPVISLSFYCEGAPGAALGAAIGNVGPGSTADFGSVGEASIPLVAVLEPDVDGDGYGDETQDKCPLSAALQTACPVTVDTFSLVGSSAVKVLVATSNAAPVKVTGTAKLGKAGKVKISTKAKTVQPGKLVTFTLKFPQKLKDKLKELEPSQKLALKIVASATNVDGQVNTDKATAKLRGQG